MIYVNFLTSKITKHPFIINLLKQKRLILLIIMCLLLAVGIYNFSANQDWDKFFGINNQVVPEDVLPECMISETYVSIKIYSEDGITYYDKNNYDIDIYVNQLLKFKNQTEFSVPTFNNIKIIAISKDKNYQDIETEFDLGCHSNKTYIFYRKKSEVPDAVIVIADYNMDYYKK